MKKIQLVCLFLFIFLLFAYIILSAGKNIFRVVTNKIYSPMAESLTNFFINPLYLPHYYFSTSHDFNVPYFTINLILSLIISFFGCVYSEFIILLFCGLEKETYYQISKRSNLNKTTELSRIESEDKSHNSDDISSSK